MRFPPAATAWRAVALLLILYALSLLDRQILYLMVDPIRADLGIDDIQIGFLQGFAFVGVYVACGVPLGWIADRFDRRLLIFAGVSVWSLATMACGLARSFEQLAAARLMVGMGEAALLPAAYSIIGDLFPRDRITKAMAVFSTGAMVGAGVALAIGGIVVDYVGSHRPVETVLLGTLRPWQLVFLLTGALGLPLTGLVFLFPEPARREAIVGEAASEAIILFIHRRWRFFACHFLGFGLIYLVSSGASAWGPSFLARRFDWSMGAIGPLLGTVVVAFGIVGFILSGRVVSAAFRRGVRDAHLRFHMVGALVLAAIGAIAPQVGSPWLAILLLGAVNLFTTVAANASAALQMVTPNRLRGRVSAIFLVFFNLLGVGAGPLAVSLFTVHLFGEEKLGMSLSLTFLLFGLLAALLLRLGMPAFARLVEQGEYHDPVPRRFVADRRRPARPNKEKLTMEIRHLGHSGLAVSALSFGTMTFGGGGIWEGIGSTQIADATRQIDLCLEAGVNLFDSADMYSMGQSEAILGAALGTRRKEVLVATKLFGQMGSDPADVGLSRRRIIECCDASLKRLGTDWIDLYQVHNHDALVPVEETLRALDDLVRAGKVRYIGCSNHSGWQLVKALGASERLGLECYVGQQIQYSLAVRDAENELLPAGLDQGVGALIWSPLAQGLLTGKARGGGEKGSRLDNYGSALRFESGPVDAVVDAVLEIAEARNVSASQVALNWLLRRPGVSTVLIGARTEAQLRDNLAAATWSLDDGDLKRLTDVSAVKLPYPNAHQHIFSPARNPDPFR